MQVPAGQLPWLRLQRFTGRGFATVDSVQLITDGLFTLQGDATAGLYGLVLDGGTRHELVLAAGENVQLSATVPQLRHATLRLQQSPENQAYFRMLQLVHRHDSATVVLHRHLRALSDTATHAQALALRQLEGQHRALNEELRRQVTAAPGTFAAQGLAPLAAVPQRPAAQVFGPGYLAWLDAHYLDNLPLAGPQLPRHPVAADRLTYYVYTLGLGLARLDSTQAASRRAALARVLARRPAAGPPLNWLYWALLTNALNRDEVADTQYLTQRFAAEKGMGPLPPAVAAELAQAQALSPGHAAPALALPDSSGTVHSLREYAARHELTVLYFWASASRVGQLEGVRLLSVQQHLGPAGLGVYAVALDEQRGPWLAALRARPTPDWLHVATLQPLAQNTALQAFHLRRVPKFILLNQHGQIIGSYASAEALLVGVKKRQTNR